MSTQNTHKNAMDLSADPQRAAEEMLSIIVDLQTVYDQETAALKSMDVDGFMAMQDQKIAAARRYESAAAQFLKRQREMQALPNGIKAKLADMQNAFADMVHKNRTALERMQRTTKRLGETIQDAAKTAIQKRTNSIYGQNGALSTSKATKNMSVGIIETA